MNTLRRLLSRGLPNRLGDDPRLAPVVVVGGVLVFATLGLLTLSATFTVSCPPDSACVTLDGIRRGAPLPEAIRIHDRHGELLAEVAGPLRIALPEDRIPERLADAFVAVEDRRFWEHGGVDARGVLRAAFRNLREGGISEGASTIPMQLVRTLWAESLRETGPWRRKVIEARTAPRLIDELGHQRVLTLYLNAIYMGNGLYGVERAARYYFGVGVDELDIGQMATLVGMTRSPELYEPRSNPERARTVRDVVLDLLVVEGIVSAEEAEEAKAGDLAVAPLDEVTRHRTKRTFFTAAVTRELRRVAPELASVQGLRIHTTLDAVIQAEGEKALATQLEAIEAGRFGRFPRGETGAPTLEGAAVALDAVDGSVLAWIGGRDFGRSQFDRVEQSQRQVGSLVKPFLVAAALEQGYGIADLVSADTVPIPTSDGSWIPADHVPELELPLREALIRSSNRAAAHLGTSIGLQSVVEVNRRAGLAGVIPAVPSTSIGSFEASLLEMTSAFSAFGNRGMRAVPHLIDRIEAPDGTVLWERDAGVDAQRVLDDGTAYVVLDALRAVVDRGTGTYVRGYGYRGPAAGKTGTTNDGRDAWFVGLTPEIVSGVWIGYDTPRPIVENRGGGALASPAWATWMQSLRGTIPQRRAWIPPPSVERVRYHAGTGEVIGPHCSVQADEGYYEAWVLAGSYDRQRCPDRGFTGWLGRLWRGISPPDAAPVRPLRRRPGG